MATITGTDKYEVVEKIGHGSFGIIHKVRRVSDGHILCRKEINYIRMSQKEREQLHAEFSILSSLRHPNIVAYYHREHLKSTQDLHLYMEYCGGGDLGRVIKTLKQRKQYAEEEFVWSIFSQLVTALYRCHYGEDAPDVGKNVMVSGNSVKPSALQSKNKVMILHRDLKPENVFLGADNSVKLGDFGLSKLMQSHDFASTYVGTPYYMSPEICAAERYTLQSDVWSLGCIMYELCTREPPFDAKTHLQLVQKIKEGRVNPLPNTYSSELQNVIKSCLKTNPSTRPDTATLIQLPAIRLMRKEREVVELGKMLKIKEELAAQKLTELAMKATSLESDKEKTRFELEATVRREWEVKARLEIDRQLQIEMERLHKKFENDVQTKVGIEVQRHLQSLELVKEHKSESPTNMPTEIAISSVSSYNDTDFPSTTDLSSLSLESPVSQKSNPKPLKKSGRGPLARARTQYDSPMDVQMAEPSPMSIASLSLSPRRNAAAAAANKIPNSKNIFATAANHRAKWEPQLPSPLPTSDEEEETYDDLDDMPELPSPTRPSRAAATAYPFKAPTRPGLLRQQTAPMQRKDLEPPIFATATTANAAPKPSFPSYQNQAHDSRAPKPISPNRRLSKLPSSASNMALKIADAGSPVRRAPARPTVKSGSKTTTGSDDMFKAVVRGNMLGTGVGGAGATTTGGGRTIVELAQARAGGNGNAALSFVGMSRTDSGIGAENLPVDDRDREPPTWDPEIHEMPSPFLRRGRAVEGR